jgi:hypothetical protein
MATKENDNEEIRKTAFWLAAMLDYIERYPRPSSVATRIDQIRQGVETLATHAYAKGD